MTDGWLFGYRECRIIEQLDLEQVRIELENGCLFVVHRALIYEEQKNNSQNWRNYDHKHGKH